MTSADDGVRAVLTRYARALNSADVALARSCFTDDAVVMPQGFPTFTTAQLPEAYARFFGVQAYDIAFVVDEVVPAGKDQVVVLTHSTGTLTRHADGTRRRGANREMFLLRADGGAWAIARYLFNNDGPAAPSPHTQEAP